MTTKPTKPFSPPDSVFFSVVNEGDPIPRADSLYVDDLLKLVVTKWPSGTVKWPLSPRKYFNAGTVLVIHKWRKGAYFLPNETGDGSVADTVMGNPKMHKIRLHLEGQKGIVFDV